MSDHKQAHIELQLYPAGQAQVQLGDKLIRKRKIKDNKVM